MPAHEASKAKTLFFALIVFIGIACPLEPGGMIALAIQYKTARYLVCGFTQQRRLQQAKARMPFVDYYKGVPSRNAQSPVDSRGLRGLEMAPQNPALRALCVWVRLQPTVTIFPVGRHVRPFLSQNMPGTHQVPGRYAVINSGQPGFGLNHAFYC